METAAKIETIRKAVEEHRGVKIMVRSGAMMTLDHFRGLGWVATTKAAGVIITQELGRMSVSIVGESIEMASEDGGRPAIRMQAGELGAVTII